MRENLTRVEISQKAVFQNIQSFKKLGSSSLLFTAVIKSNAYGHGLLEMGAISLRAGADLLGVNSLEEARELKIIYWVKRVITIFFLT